MIRVIMFILVAVPLLSLNAQSAGEYAESTETTLWLQSDRLVVKQQGWFDNSASAWISRGAIVGAATLDIWSTLHLQNKAAQDPMAYGIEINPLLRNSDGVGKNPKKYKGACLKQAKKFDTKVFIKKITEELENIIN